MMLLSALEDIESTALNSLYQNYFQKYIITKIYFRHTNEKLGCVHLWDFIGNFLNKMF